MRGPTALSDNWYGALLAMTAGLGFFILGIANAGRSFRYDESVTVGFFVRQPSLWDAVTSQRVFNNQPLLSGINWVVYHAGGTSEVWQRVPAIVAGSLCIALVAWWAHARWGVLAALVAVGIVVTNPLFVGLSSQARGYSFATLMVVGSTLLVVDERHDLRDRWVGRSYALAVTLGLLSHLYVALAVLGHGALILARQRERLPAWRTSTAGGVLMAMPIYAVMAPDMAATTRRLAEASRPYFPGEAMSDVFGSRSLGVAGVALTAALLLTCRRAWPFALTVLGSVAVIWFFVQPVDLYVRFFLWVVPLLALVAARATARRRLWLLPLAAFAVATAPHAAEELRKEPGIREAARAGVVLSEKGHDVCAGGYYWESFAAYAFIPPQQAAPECDAIIVLRSQAGSEQFADEALAEIPGVGDMCVAAEPHVLLSAGFRPATCP